VHSTTDDIFYIQQQRGPRRTGNDRTSVEKCKNHNATAEKHGWYLKFSMTTSKIPWLPDQINLLIFQASADLCQWAKSGWNWCCSYGCNYGPLLEKMTSSIKLPPQHNVSRRYQRRTEPRPSMTCTELVKFSIVLFWDMWMDRQTDQQTYSSQDSASLTRAM